jgi:thiamine pyrophosphokinase
MKCVIVCNGYGINKELIAEYLDEETYLICADGGANHLEKLGIAPDILIGDFDSISDKVLAGYKAKGIEVIPFPPEKDYTDSELAVETALSKGFKKITILGGIGTRMDHTLANINLLKKILEAGCEGIIADENNVIRITSSNIKLKRKSGYKVTLLALTPEVQGVTTKDLYYPLKNFTLVQGSTRGVSNEFISEEAAVSIESGLLLVIMARD